MELASGEAPKLPVTPPFSEFLITFYTIEFSFVETAVGVVMLVVGEAPDRGMFSSSSAGFSTF